MYSTPIRRVVTGHDVDGRSTVSLDSTDLSVLELGQLTLTDIWEMSRVPTAVDDLSPTDGQEQLVLEPRAGGLKLRIVEYDPEELATVDSASDFAAMGAAHAHESDSGRHPTRTVDFGIVLQGEITMILDHREVPLRAGDVVIQRATAHGWSNRGTVLARVAFVLVDADT